MKIVKFKGGFGNQLFQYVFLRALQLNYHCEDVKADLSYFIDVENDRIRVPRIEELNITMDKASQSELADIWMFSHKGDTRKLRYRSAIFFEKTFNRQYYFESDRSYRNLEDILQYQYYDGYWQSWRYLAGIENQIRDEIRLLGEPGEKTQKIIAKISNENAVFLGIRRGDYVETPRARKHFGSYDNAYFNQAIEIIKKRVANPVFYIFSNDIEWVKQNMRFDCEKYYREDEDQTSDTEELFVMAACKHAIIVNSTFQWWGAWLIENENKIVIAPQRWFADGAPIDIVPDAWIKL
jgi:hypothetical protein